MGHLQGGPKNKLLIILKINLSTAKPTFIIFGMYVR